MSLSVSNESLSSIMAIFPTTHPYSNDAMNSKSLKYSVLYSINTPIELSFI